MSSSSSSKARSTSSQNYSQKNVLSLFEDQKFLKTLLDYSGYQMAVFDNQARFIYVNNSALKAIGYSRSFIMKKRAVDFMKADISLAKWKREYFEKAKKSRHPLSLRFERIVKGGTVQVLDATFVYVPYGKSGVLLCIGRDVSRAAQLQNMVDETRALYRKLMERAGDGILVLDLAGRIIYANTTMQEMTGYKPKDFQKKHFKHFIYKSSLNQAKEFFAQAARGRKTEPLAIEIIASSGERIPVETNATGLIENKKVTAVQVIARDTRPRLAMEAGHREEEKMNALRFFVSGTAQELKNPLLAICRQASVVLQKYKDRDFEYISYKEFQEILDNFKRVHDRVSYCYETVDRLLRFSERKAGIQHDACSIHSVLKKSVDLKQDDLHLHGIHYRLKLFKGSAKVGIGEIDLTQICVNIINNAIQAMPSGGGLLIKTVLDKPSGCVVIEFKDQGVGIAEELLEHIFEPFFTTKVRGVRKNSGLGLPIAFSLVKRVQGDMTVESRLGKGTTIRIFLPVVHEK